MVGFFHGHVSFQGCSGFVGGANFIAVQWSNPTKPSQIHWRDSLLQTWVQNFLLLYQVSDLWQAVCCSFGVVERCMIFRDMVWRCLRNLEPCYIRLLFPNSSSLHRAVDGHIHKCTGYCITILCGCISNIDIKNFLIRSRFQRCGSRLRAKPVRHEFLPTASLVKTLGEIKMERLGEASACISQLDVFKRDSEKCKM